VVQELASELDLFATCIELAGGRLPADRPYDSHSLMPLFRGTGSGSRNEVFYDDDDQVTDARQGPWKLHQKTIEAASGLTKSQIQSPPLLFNVATDPSERFNVVLEHSDVIQRLMKVIEAHHGSVTPGKPPALKLTLRLCLPLAADWSERVINSGRPSCEGGSARVRAGLPSAML